MNNDDSATDVLQTTWLRLLENVDSIHNPDAIRGWLATTARREAIAVSKRLARQRPEDELTIFLNDTSERNSDPSDPADLVTSGDEMDSVLAAMRRLSKKCQELLTLTSHKLSYSEIAASLDIPIGSIGPSRSRCLDQLRRSPELVGISAAPS